MTTALCSALSSDYTNLFKGLQSQKVTLDLRQRVSLALERQLSGQLANSSASSLINHPVASQVHPLSALPSFPAKSSSKQHPPLTASNSVANCNAASHLKTVALKEHRKLDRSVSEPVDKSQQTLRPAPPSSSRYKTELCRPFEESGTCKYGDKCQFAHGMAELRTLSRHPKYKTELCRTFHSTGFCPYGPRCHFIHNSGEVKKYMDSLHGQQSPPLSPVYQDLRFEGIDYQLSYNQDLVNPSDLRELHRPGSTGDLSPNSSISSSGSPTSPMGGFFMEDVTCTVPQHPEAVIAPAANRVEVFRQDYVPIKPLSALPCLIPQTSSPPPPPVSQEEALSTFKKLVSNFKELECSANLPFSNAECSAKPEPSAAVDINRNIRLPIFSKLSLGNSPP